VKEAVQPVKVRTPSPDFRNTRPEQFSLNLGYPDWRKHRGF